MSETVPDHDAGKTRLEAIEREVRRIKCPHGVIPDWLEADGMIHVRVDCDLCSSAGPESYRALLGPIPRVAFSLDAIRAPESVVPAESAPGQRGGGNDAAQTLAGGSLTPLGAVARSTYGPPTEPSWSRAIPRQAKRDEFSIPSIEAADARREAFAREAGEVRVSRGDGTTEWVKRPGVSASAAEIAERTGL